MKSITYIWRTIAISVFVLLIVVVVFFSFNSSMLSKTLNRERLANESMLSENIHLNRDLNEMSKELSLVNQRNIELIGILDTSRIHTNK